MPPQYTISVVIPEAGFGGAVAAPLAFRILAPASNGDGPAGLHGGGRRRRATRRRRPRRRRPRPTPRGWPTDAALRPAPARPAPTFRARDLSAPWRHVDIALLIVVGLIAVIGLVMVVSATRRFDGGAGVVARQAFFVRLGVVAMALISLVDYRRIADWWPVIYVGRHRAAGRACSRRWARR